MTKLQNLSNYCSRAVTLKYVAAFFMVVHSKSHIYTAKQALLKYSSISGSDKNITEIDAMGFQFKIMGSGQLSYKMNDDSTRILVLGEVGEPIFKIIDVVDENRPLKLIRNEIE